MADARTEVLAAMSTYAQANSAGDLFCDHAGLLDAIPTAALVRLVIDRGGLEQVGWRWQELLFGSWVTHHWEPDDDLPKWPVYRLSEEPS